HTHTHTHTHTHRHLASPNLFLRARGSYANLRRHKGYSHLLCYVFRVLSAIDIRENKERFYPQNPHDFRAANTPISVNINSRSADRPHVGTDPVSVRLTSVLRTEAILLVERYERLRIYPGLAPDGCGQTRGLSLHAGWARIGIGWEANISADFGLATDIRRYVCHLIPNHIPPLTPCHDDK
ncbi:hypothetical protein HMPREF9140_00417, partial [Prevotella micans F0438]